MTTRVQTATHMPMFPRIPWLIIGAVLLLGLAVFLLSNHALKHSDAPAIRACLEQNGPSQIWVKKGQLDIKYLLCNLPDGRTCWMIAQTWPSKVQGSDFREITSYCPDKGIFEKVIARLEKIAVRIL